MNRFPFHVVLGSDGGKLAGSQCGSGAVLTGNLRVIKRDTDEEAVLIYRAQRGTGWLERFPCMGRENHYGQQS